MFEADLKLFLLVPSGYPEKTVIVIASNKEEAYRKGMDIPDISRCVHLLEAELKIKEIQKMFEDQGYEIFIARKGMYH